MMLKRFKLPAFSLIEIVVVLFLVVVIVPAVNNVISQSVRAMATTQREVEALYLAQEGMEAVRAMRDSSWSNIADFEGTNYLNDVSGGLSFSETPSLIDGIYERQVIVSPAYRDGNDDLADSGDPETEAKKIEVIITWSELNGGSKSISLQTYVTNFQY